VIAQIDKVTSYLPTQWWQEPTEQVDGMLDPWVESAQRRLERFKPYFMANNPDTNNMCGLLESPVLPLQQFAGEIAPTTLNSSALNMRLFLKADHTLPISGSIKARGGIHEVLAHAEQIALDEGLIDPSQDYSQFSSPRFRQCFSTRQIVVGSTGNLGLSIGLMGAQLGFAVHVHMSKDAKPWKVERLRKVGASVILHDGDYGRAVAVARNTALAEPNAYFVDDERSIQLFSGYAVGGRRLKAQLEGMGIYVNSQRPLYVYLPCGVGGGPGGVAYGLKQVFGADVYSVFVEPTHAPCFLLAMLEGGKNAVDVATYGIDNQTQADGLAVGCASELALAHAGPLLSGVVTVDDAQLFRDLTKLADLEGIFVEPSAAAGFEGLRQMLSHGAHPQGIHIIWATGGSMVPKEEMNTYYLKGMSEETKYEKIDAGV